MSDMDVCIKPQIFAAVVPKGNITFKPQIYTSWIPNGKIIFTPLIFVTYIPSPVRQISAADTFRSVEFLSGSGNPKLKYKIGNEKFSFPKTKVFSVRRLSNSAIENFLPNSPNRLPQMHHTRELKLAAKNFLSQKSD